MSDLISRKMALDEVNKIAPVDTEYDCVLLDRLDVRYVLTELPSAEPEIIRCEDCRYSSPNHVYGCRVEPFDVNERDERMYSNDYCSKAILREVNRNENDRH